LNTIRLSLPLLAGVALVAGCGHKREPQRALEASLLPATVRVQKIDAVNEPAVEEVVGTIQPKLRATIETKVSGRITHLPVTLGQTIKQGELLLELATQEVQARLDQANATFKQAELDFKRISNLRKQGAVTQSEFEAAQTRFTVAQGAVAEAEALSGYGKIVAPFDGVVARKMADEGDLALPGKALLELEGRSGLRLEADAPTLLVNRIEPGASLDVQVDTLTNSLTGKVAEIAPAADPASRTVRVKVDLPAASGLRAGQFGRLAVPLNQTSFLFIPPSALVQRGQLEIVFVESEGKARMRLVRSGRQAARGIEILAGLSPGESVVVEGAANLQDGQPLQTR
jgi:RND family efflux transporter MFP subunit